MTPAQVIDELKKGNERFRAGKMTRRDYLAEQRSSAKGQSAAAVILSGCRLAACRRKSFSTPVSGIHCIARVAGNVINDDILGSMEFGCAASGAKVVVVLGHTACGAIKGAIDDVVLGNLTGLLARIKPAVAQTKYDGEKSATAVTPSAKQRPAGGREIHRRSPILEDLSKKGSIAIAGAMLRIWPTSASQLPGVGRWSVSKIRLRFARSSCELHCERSVVVDPQVKPYRHRAIGDRISARHSVFTQRHAVVAQTQETS